MDSTHWVQSSRHRHRCQQLNESSAARSRSPTTTNAPDDTTELMNSVRFYVPLDTEYVISDTFFPICKLCALNLFFGRDNELQTYHGNFHLMGNRHRKLFAIKQSKGYISMPQHTHTHTHTFNGPLSGDKCLKCTKICLAAGLQLEPLGELQSGGLHTHPFNGPFSWTTRVSWYQKGKNQSGFY